MSTDKELLELAAKVSGIEGLSWSESWEAMVVSRYNYFNHWNPLKDDGDAFRLAVNLKITVEQSILENKVSAYVLNRQTKSHWVEISGCADRAEATRRAIVRAAAEIGKQMENTK